MSFLDNLPLAALFVLSAAAALGCGEIGYRLALRRKADGSTDGDAPVGTMVAAILALLAFMLAFTFGVATTRFEERRTLVVKEANAIGTAYLRTDILEEPSKTNLKTLLRKYVAVRAETGGLLGDGNYKDKLALVARIINDSETLQRTIWQETAAVVQKHDSPVYAQFMVSINELIDVHGERVAAAMSARVPQTVWVGLLLTAALAMTGMGYYCGLVGRRNTMEMFIMVLSFSMALMIVVDLDRPFEGTIRVSQSPMLDLNKTMNSENTNR